MEFFQMMMKLFWENYIPDFLKKALSFVTSQFTFPVKLGQKTDLFFVKQVTISLLKTWINQTEGL